MLKLTRQISLDESEIMLSFIRAPGPGGQNVNKIASAVQLRFDVVHSPSLPEDVRRRLLTQARNKISQSGELIIKASRFRTQERNKQDALERLKALLINAEKIPKRRKPTKPSRAVTEKRLQKKKLHSKNKAIRRQPLEPNLSYHCL